MNAKLCPVLLLLLLLPAGPLRAADDDCCDGRKDEPTAEEVAHAAFRGDLAVTVAAADEVEIFSIATAAQRKLPPDQRFDIGPDARQFMQINQRRVLLEAERREFLVLLVALLRDPNDHVGGASTHQPKYGVRLRKDGREILATSFSWESRNFWLHYPGGGPGWVGFDPAAMRTFCEKVLPEPGVVQLLTKPGMFQTRDVQRLTVTAEDLGREIKITLTPRTSAETRSSVQATPEVRLNLGVRALSYGTTLRNDREWFVLAAETGRLYLGEDGGSLITYDVSPGGDMEARSVLSPEKDAILEKYRAAKKQAED